MNNDNVANDFETGEEYVQDAGSAAAAAAVAQPTPKAEEASGPSPTPGEAGGSVIPSSPPEGILGRHDPRRPGAAYSEAKPPTDRSTPTTCRRCKRGGGPKWADGPLRYFLTKSGLREELESVMGEFDELCDRIGWARSELAKDRIRETALARISEAANVDDLVKSLGSAALVDLNPQVMHRLTCGARRLVGVFISEKALPVVLRVHEEWTEALPGLRKEAGSLEAELARVSAKILGFEYQMKPLSDRLTNDDEALRFHVTRFNEEAHGRHPIGPQHDGTLDEIRLLLAR